MLESYITPILMGYVDKYIKNLKPSDLNLSLWGGDVSLSNLELNLHALEKELKLPITFLSGKIHELHIHVPWTKLYYEPAVITINTIECVLKLQEHEFTSEGAEEVTEVRQADIETPLSSAKPQAEVNESPLPPGYVQSLLNKVIYNLTIRVNNFILKYVEDDIVLSLNVKSAEFHSANENWVKAFVDVAAPDWILHKVCNISDLTVCLDRRNASGIIEMYQDPLAYKCSLSCRTQVYYDKEGFHLPLEKNVNVYCECLEISITDQQLPLLLRLFKLGLSLYYGTLDIPGCQASPHAAKEELNKKDKTKNPGLISGLPGTLIPGNVPGDEGTEEAGWFSWAMSMVPTLTEDTKTSGALFTPQISRFGVYISQANLNFKVTEPVIEGNFVGPQRFVFKTILTLEASGVASEMVTKGISFLDFQYGVTTLTGWMVDQCVCKNSTKVPKMHDGGDSNVADAEEELFLRLGGKETSMDKGISFLKGSLFDDSFISGGRAEIVGSADEFLRRNSESNVLSRFGAVFFEYLYTMDIKETERDSYYESTPSVKEVSHQRVIVGPSLFEVTSGMVHRMELILKFAEDDANLRKEKNEVFYDEFIKDQLLSGNVSNRHLHVTILDASLVILQSDHLKHQTQKDESVSQTDASLSGIQEEPYVDHSPVTTGCVFQVERLDFQKTSPMFPKELLKLIEDKKAGRTLLQHAHSNMFGKVFGFQVAVSKHDVETENPMILNVLPACNLSLFAKQSLMFRQSDRLSAVEARFELATLSLNITKPQFILLQDIYNSWTAPMASKNLSSARSSLVQDVFHPSARQGGKIPVLVEACVQDTKAQLCITSESICSSGSVGSVRATVLSLSGEKTECSPVLYGPLVTSDVFNGECFRNYDERSFRLPVMEPWFAYTVKIPLQGHSEKPPGRQHAPNGAFLLKCKGTALNLDPVVFTWMSYQPRMSSPCRSQTPSRNKLRRSSSQTRLISSKRTRKKSYARGHVSSKSPVHAQKKPKHSVRKQRSRQRSLGENSSQDFDEWVWEKLPLLASVIIQVDVESFVILAPTDHLPYEDFHATGGYDIPRNFVRQLHKGLRQPDHPSGLAISLPTLRIRSSNHQDLAVCQDILRHPLTLPPREQAETLPWVLTADNASVFTVWRAGSTSLQGTEVYFLLNPMSCRALLASARTSHTGGSTNGVDNKDARLDFVVHTDFNPLTINCSKKQVDLLLKLYSSAAELASPQHPHMSAHDSDALFGAKSVPGTPAAIGHFPRRTASITSSSGFEAVEEDSLSSESTPKPVSSFQEPVEVSPLLVRVSLWVQWTLPKLSFHVFGSSPAGGSDLRVTTELEDLSASFDYQNGQFKAQSKVGNLGVTHWQMGTSGQWVSGPGGGTLLSRQDSLSSSLPKVHAVEVEDESSDLGSHSFLYIEYTGSSVNFLSGKISREISEHDELFENSFRYRQEVHVTIQPFDVILWCPVLYTITTLFQKFALFQARTAHTGELKVSPSLASDQDIVQTVTNLPDVSIKLKGFRIVVPARIELKKNRKRLKREKLVVDTDLFAVQGSSLLVKSRPDNPVSRLVVDKKLGKSLRSFIRSHRGLKEDSIIGDVQYQLEVKGLRVWSGCWDELCRTLPRQDTAEIERELLEQNPALEWNTYSTHDRASSVILPVISEFDIKSVVALPVSLFVSHKSREWHKPIFGLSLELNLPTDVECYLSKTQVQLTQSILVENITNNGLANNDFPSCPKTRENPPDNREHTMIHPSGEQLVVEKLDSGVGSECTLERCQPSRTKSRNLSSVAEVQPIECLFTAGRLSVSIYDTETRENAKGWSVPVVRVSFFQPAFMCTRVVESSTVQISCFDVSLAKSEENYRSSNEIQLIPCSDDFSVVWFRTGDGRPDKHTELPPAFVNCQCKIYPSSPADVKLNFGRPTWIDIDFDLLEKVKCFTTDLLPHQEMKSSSESGSQPFNVRSMALATDYAALTFIAGRSRNSSPMVKLAFSSLNLGVSFKMDEKEYSQQTAGNLNICALTLSTSFDGTVHSLLLPYDASVDLEMSRVSPSCSESKSSSGVSETFLWLDSGLLQVNFGQEHLRCLSSFSENVSTFMRRCGVASADRDDSTSPKLVSQTAPTVHRTYDDLRTGPFQYVTSAGIDSRPEPNEIIFADDGLPTMTWRYPEPRALSAVHITPVPFTTDTSYPSPVVMEDDRLLPCILRYWDSIQKSYVEHVTFYISENSSIVVDIRDPMLNPLSDVIAAAEWQVVADVAVSSEDSDPSSDDGSSSVASVQRISPISATSLAACMRVDSVFCPQFVPTLSVAATFSIVQLTVFNHLQTVYDATSKKFKGFTLQEDTPKEQEFIRMTCEETTAMLKTWPADATQFSFLILSNVQGDVLNYRDLTWSSLLRPVDLSLAVVKDLTLQPLENNPRVIAPNRSFDFSCGDLVVDVSQSRLHTLATGLMAWQGVEGPVLSHFIVCNKTNVPFRFGQVGTDENILLGSKEMAFYGWRSTSDVARQNLRVCLETDCDCRWCEPFGINSPGVVTRAVHFGLHTATLVIEVKRKSGLQRQVIVYSSHVVTNYTSHDVEVQLLQNPALSQITSPALQVLHNILVPAQCSSPSYVISHGGLAGIRVRLRSETTWSGTLPLEDQLPHYKQHHVVQMLGTKEFKNFYIWYNVTSADKIFGQVQISFSPLFIIRNHLPHKIEMTTVSASGNESTTHEPPGRGMEYHVFDLSPDTWHYVRFTLQDAKAPSNPAVPLNTTLFELTEKIKRDSEDEEDANTEWPYSSKSGESCVKPYLKPAESSLVRHVQSCESEGGEHLEKEAKADRCAGQELHCQILNKWGNLRSIVLEVKPCSLVENKSSVTIYLEDPTTKAVFGLIPGQVLSPVKLESFRIGVLPPWLQNIVWSDTVCLVDENQPQTVSSGLSLEQYAQIQCSLVLPGSPAPQRICSILIASAIARGIRIITMEDTARIVCMDLPTPLYVQPVVISDFTSKIKEDVFTADSQILLNPEAPPNIIGKGVTYWDVSAGKQDTASSVDDAMYLLLFGVAGSGDSSDQSCSGIRWSRPIRIEQGIVRQSVSLQTSSPSCPLALVVITLIENGLIKVVVVVDPVPRVFLVNLCASSFQYGQCPTTADKQKARRTSLSGRDLVVSENLETYTRVSRLDPQTCMYYEPPDFRESFLTKKPQSLPKLRVQYLRRADIKEDSRSHVDWNAPDRTPDRRVIEMPQGWSEPIDVSHVGKMTYNLPGNDQLHVEVSKKTSFLTHVVFSDTCNALDTLESSQELSEIKVKCHASSLSLCLYDEATCVQPTEVLRVNLEEASVTVLCVDGGETHAEVHLGGLQIDNQMENDFYHFPVIVVPLENESRNNRRKAKKTLKPLLSCCIDFTPNADKTHVRVLSVALEPMSLFIEDMFLYKLAGMMDSFILPESEARQDTDDDFRALRLASAVISPTMIDRLDIAPLYVLVTFHASVKLFVSADHTPLSFGRFHMTSVFTDPSFLAQLLAAHYAYSALMKVGWILGSLDIIGCPATLMRSLGQGIADFFYLPYDGLTRGPGAFVTGITSGMSSFMSHISAGALTSLTNLASSMSRNMDRLSFDEHYIRLQEEQRAAAEPRRLISGFTHGCRGFLLSVLAAVAGVADQPMQEFLRAESVSDATSGVVTGVGKGLLGAVTKPLGGAMELVSQTGQGILQGTGLGECPQRLHEPDASSAVTARNSHLKYSWKLLEPKAASDSLLSMNVSVFVSGNPYFDAVLFISSESILFVDQDDDTVLKSFPLVQTDMREDPQHPRAILLVYHHACADSVSEISSTTGFASTNVSPSLDVTQSLNSHQFLLETDALMLTLFLDPAYLRPLLSRFRLYKGSA